MKKTLIFLIVTMMVLVIWPSRAQAAYNPGNLISDAEFVNWRTLDTAGVQQFLNTKAGTRLRTFSEGGRSAAQIIADASRANGVNPLVILATIQKEESLVESNYNFDFRVNWAMGYAVCDSCSLDDPSVAANRGFTKQIDNGAWQLKRNYSYHAANGSDWTVGRTMVIDGTAVRFANRATSALYRYTPHLHGNENFYNIYNRYKTFYYKSPSVKGAISKSAAAANKRATAAKTKAAKTKAAKTKAAGSKTGQSVQTGATYAAQYVTQIGAGALRPGQKRTVYAYFRNTGTATWRSSGANPVYLGNSSPQDRQSDFTGGNSRWRLLSAAVPPGRTGVFSIQITAPSSGNYTERFRPLAEGLTWFGDESTFTFNVR